METGCRAVAVVCASSGYPGKYKKGLPISGLDTVRDMGLHVFHSGTRLSDGGAVLTDGGRVLSVVCTAGSFLDASWGAYQGAMTVQYEGKIYRNDIAAVAIFR